MESNREGGMFDHERLEVYGVAVALLAETARVGRRIRQPDGFLRSQLLRASTSICFNIAEGASEYSRPEKARFYRIARRSAGETAAILHALAILGIADPKVVRPIRERLERVSAMLTRLIRTHAIPSETPHT
jgi:four helix bundle protein